MFENTRLYEVASRIESVQNRTSQMFKIILDVPSVKELIIRLNTEVQLRQNSQDSLGNALFNQFTNRSFYAASDPLGRGGQPYQVRQTGYYYDSFIVVVGQDEIIIDSDPNKSQGSLFEMYTPNIEGLTDENINTLNLLVNELYVKWYRDNIIR